MQNSYFNNGYGMYNSVSTNIVKVTSLEEAIMRTTVRPSDMVYFNQDKDEFYNVKIDYEGRKTWATFPYSIPNSDVNVPASKADILGLTSRIEALEAKLGTQSGGTNNAEPNG
jgi:hypothetical protein